MMNDSHFSLHFCKGTPAVSLCAKGGYCTAELDRDQFVVFKRKRLEKSESVEAYRINCWGDCDVRL